MAFGRSDEQETPHVAKAIKRRIIVWGLFGETHLGQRSVRLHKQAGHMTAIAPQSQLYEESPCVPRAVHTCDVTVLTADQEDEE